MRRYGTHFGRLNTWWPMAGAWMSYLGRCQFLLQQGHPVADLLVLADEEADYPLSPAPELGIPPGSDFDACYPRHLESLEWKDRAFRSPTGAAYRILLLPKRWTASLATLQRLKTFLSQGAVIAGSPPIAPTGLLDQRNHLPEWDALVADVFGQVKAAVSLNEPDVIIAEPDIFWRHRARIERELGGWESDIYFVSNQSGKPVTVQASFRAGRRAPEIWNPVTGQHAETSPYRVEDSGRISLPLTLDVSGSTFVVFRRILIAPDEQVRASPVVAPLEPVVIRGPWRVQFQPGRGAPEPITLEKLSSWTQQTDPGVKYFSGIATYSTAFDLPAVSGDPRWVLNLGQVCDIAEVKVNGRRAGVAWTAPFEFDITGLVHAGRNALEIAVANRWVNRLIGDELLLPDARYEFTGSKFTSGRLAELPPWLGNTELTRKRQRITFATWHFYDKDSPLLDSGLIGPVRLVRR